jgi:hypothetical protein
MVGRRAVEHDASVACVGAKCGRRRGGLEEETRDAHGRESDADQ